MNRFVYTLLTLALLGSTARADLITMSSTAPPGSPLAMSPGTTSSSIFVTISNNVNTDPATSFMTAWQFRLVIQSIGGTTGTLTFNNPATGTPANPSNYIFGPSGLGVSVTNGGSFLTANDFDSNSNGTQVPIAIRNLLQFDVSASGGASGTFGIFAEEGLANTIWTDAVPASRFFVNVPNGTTFVQIGEITIAAVPEPSTIALFAVSAGVCGLGLAGYRHYRRVNRFGASC